MIYLLYGNDTQKAIVKYNSLLDTLRTRKPDAQFFQLNDETYQVHALDELVYGQGLFEQKYIVGCNNVCRDKDIKEEVVGKLKDIAASDNIFVFLEETLDAASKKKFEKYAEKVQVFEKRAEAKDTFNLFALTDALGERNKKRLWLLYQEATMRHMAPEEIHGVLFWQIKSLALAQYAQTPEEAGLKPYPFKKAKSSLRNFPPEDIKRMLTELVDLYHDARMGKYDLGTALERFVLTI